MKRTLIYLGTGLLLGSLTVWSGCGAGNAASDDDDGSGNSGTGASGATGHGGDGGLNLGGNNTGGGGPGPCDAAPSNEDNDGDGFTEDDGDCNDCDPNVNPGAMEVPTDPNDPEATVVDEDCDGQEDEPFEPCDSGLALTDFDPNNGVKAIDLCDTATPGGTDFGVLSAQYVRADGGPANNAVQVGVLDHFGPNVPVQVGERMLALSSGHARRPGDPDDPAACSPWAYSCDLGLGGTAPPGFPQDVPDCDGSNIINDDVGLEVALRAPTNATGYQFSFKFYTFEFAEWVCTPFNDQFIALVAPEPQGSINGNISFDQQGNPVSVNIAFFDVCNTANTGTGNDSPPVGNDWAYYCNNGFGSPPCPAQPNPYCPAGTNELMGTGFLDAFGSGLEDGGATAWLQTTAPIGPGEEFTIRFAVWDTDDTWFDSTVVIDAFQWVATPGTAVGTIPVPR